MVLLGTGRTVRAAGARGPGGSLRRRGAGGVVGHVDSSSVTPEDAGVSGWSGVHGPCITGGSMVSYTSGACNPARVMMCLVRGKLTMRLPGTMIQQNCGFVKGVG